MQLFYDPNIEGSQLLNPTDSNHCVRVLRHSVGDVINVMDGKGNWLECKITDANSKKCRVEVLNKKTEQPRQFKLHMAVAPTKNIDRFEWFLEKATEMGIEEITPLLCNHSERKVIKPERLEKVIISATKQSLKAYKPKLNPLITVNDFVKQENISENRYIAHCYETPKALLKTAYSLNQDATILIGPEGDFSEEEVEMAIKNGFNAVSLGDARLRTETAALAAVSTINILNL